MVFEGEINKKLRSFEYDGKTIYFEEVWDSGEVEIVDIRLNPIA